MAQTIFETASIVSLPIPSTANDTAGEDEQDQSDMTRLMNGNDAALNELMERHGAKLINYLTRCLQDADLAADLAQETFVRVYQHRTKFDARHRFSPWLYRIASNLMRDHFRHAARHPEVVGLADDLGEKTVGQEPLPSERIQVQERANAVRAAVTALPEELRIPLILAEYEDRSQAEIGEILGCSAKAVETRIYRARHQLRAKLNRLLA